MTNDENWLIYLLQNTSTGHVYGGCTNDIDRRIKQHNGLLKGGAKYTRSRKCGGEWKVKAFIGYTTRSMAGKLEARIKKKIGLEKRLTEMKKITDETDLFLTEVIANGLNF